MKSVRIVLSLSLLAMTAVNASPIEGNGTSGGGGAFVCRNQSQEITASYLLDLWEAQNLYGLNVQTNSTESVHQQVSKALKKLASADSLLAVTVEGLIDPMFKDARVLGSDIELPAPSDANIQYQKKGCPLQGMMFYDGSLNQLQIAPEVFNKLASNTDVAAARIHEALYYALRNHTVANTKRFSKNLVNSIPVRKLVGCLFSDDSKCLSNSVSKQDFLDDAKEAYFCTNKNVSYYLFKKGEKFNQLAAGALCRQTNHDWIGMYNHVGSDAIGVPALFISYEGSPETPSCSPLSQYGFMVSTNVRDNLGKGTNGLPYYKDIYDGDSNTVSYGTPQCAKIK